jgi:hypothetical protein
MSGIEADAYADLCNMPRLFNDFTAMHMDCRMSFPPCNEPPAPRHHVTPASLDLNLHMPLDNEETVAFIGTPPTADIDATLRSGFRYKLLKIRSFKRFSAMAHHQHRLRTLAYLWVMRVIKNEDQVFLYDPNENSQVVAMIIKAVQHNKEMYTDPLGLWSADCEDVAHVTADQIIHSLFDFEQPSYGFHEHRYKQLGEMSAKARSTLFAWHK